MEELVGEAADAVMRSMAAAAGPWRLLPLSIGIVRVEQYVFHRGLLHSQYYLILLFIVLFEKTHIINKKDSNENI